MQLYPVRDLRPLCVWWHPFFLVPFSESALFLRRATSTYLTFRCNISWILIWVINADFTAFYIMDISKLIIFMHEAWRLRRCIKITWGVYIHLFQRRMNFMKYSYTLLGGNSARPAVTPNRRIFDQNNKFWKKLLQLPVPHQPKSQQSIRQQAQWGESNEHPLPNALFQHTIPASRNNLASPDVLMGLSMIYNSNELTKEPTLLSIFRCPVMRQQ